MNDGARLRLATWNTWWCFERWAERQPLIDATIANLDPDALLLQETWPEQARRVADRCDLEVVAFVGGPFDPPVLETVDPDHPFGVAVLARPDTGRTVAKRTLPTSPDDAAPRAGLAVVVGSDGVDWLVVTTHLNHQAEAGAVRRSQLDELRRWIGELRSDGPAAAGPVLLGGDLNQVPSSQEYARSIAPHWTDLWAIGQPADAGSTMVPDNPRLTATSWMADRNPPGAAPGVRLDYLLALDRPDVPAITVERIERFGGEADSWPSDHLGLVADIRSHR